jgi:hypothetical protein
LDENAGDALRYPSALSYLGVGVVKNIYGKILCRRWRVSPMNIPFLLKM